MTETLNILETCCFPKGCCIEKESRPYLATVLVPELKKTGMSVLEYTRGALMLEEPFLTKVRNVVCRGCMHTECSHNMRAGEEEILGKLRNCAFAGRHLANAQLAETLLPKAKIDELATRGVKIDSHVISSRSRVIVSIGVTIGESKHSITLNYREQEKNIEVWGSKRATHPLPAKTDEIVLRLHEIIESLV